MLVKTYDVLFSTKNGEKIKPKLFQEVHRHVYLPAVNKLHRILCRLVPSLQFLLR